MGTWSIWHWLVVLLIVLLVFGTKKLRNIGADLGGAVRGFKDGMKSSEDKPGEGGAAPQVTGRTIEAEGQEKAKTRGASRASRRPGPPPRSFFDDPDRFASPG